MKKLYMYNKIIIIFDIIFSLFKLYLFYFNLLKVIKKSIKCFIDILYDNNINTIYYNI